MSERKLPRHIAIIMDGNGRWARQRFMPRVMGHRAGIEAARQTVQACIKHQIEVLSLFAFSSENWRRPLQEVNFLMDLFLNGLDKEIAVLHDNNVHIRFIGERTQFSRKLFDKMHQAEELTAKNTGLKLLIAIDYGGRWDICEATKKIARAIENNQLASTAITPELFASYLSFGDLPDPDLFIRTSGELRISNFMLWQIAYAELYFTNVFWPDFNEQELIKALDHYANRERRFGKSSEQLTALGA